ncbi:MAG: hypothetical protein RL734_943 [Bacteroidota bacterium]|jgi:hypothetical protein
MKRFITYFTGAFILCLCTVNAQLPFDVYGGLNIASTSTTDFSMFDISDWEKFGLKSVNPSSSEGRVRIDLANMKPSTMNIGVMVGALKKVNDNLTALFEIQYSLSGIELLATNIGVNYSLMKGDKLNLDFTPKVGYTRGSADLGAISVITGYTPPVILTEGTFNEGDNLSMEFSGLQINLGITPTYKINDKLSLMGNIGYNLGFTSSDGLLCNGVTLPMSSKGVVQSAGLGNVQAGISPSITSSGLSFQIGVMYKLSEK